MADYSAKVYMKQGGDELVVASGGKITNAGTQAAHIADPTGGTTSDTEARAAIAAILDALEGVGILAAS
jgi:hypothetical protein